MPTLTELKQDLTLKLGQQQERFASAKSADVSEDHKHFVLEEFHRAEPELKTLRAKIAESEKFDAAQKEVADEIKAMNAPDRVTPFDIGTAGRAKVGFDIDKHHAQGLGELIASSEATKSFVSGVRGSKRSGGFEVGEFKSLADGFFNPRSLAQIEEATAHLSAGEAEAIKATFTTALSGYTTYQRLPGTILQGTQPPSVASLIPQGQTDANRILYVRESAFTPSAAATAEGGLKPDASFATSEAEAPVRKIAVTTKMTEELMEDFPAARDYINQRLPYMVEIETDNQLLNGNGTTPNLRGLLNATGILLHARGFGVDETTAIAGDNEPDAIMRAMTRVAAESFFTPTATVLNHFNWMNIRLMRSGTGDAAGGAGRGLYLFGNPSDTGLQTLWGMPVIPTTRIAFNTALVGAFNLGAQIFRRMGIRVDMTNSNEDDFRRNLVAIRAEERLALCIYRPQAFCRVNLTPTA